MQILTQSLLDSTRKASRFLQRDFAELEMLQTSISPLNDFINRSLLKTTQKLKEELEKHPYPILEINDQLPKTCNKAIVIIPIDSMVNFSKSLPFFASASFVIENIEDNWEATNMAVHFPALSEIYYAEKSGGAWCEKYGQNDRGSRLRVSGCRSLHKALIGTNNATKFHDSSIRDFGSIFYMITTFAAGKFDALYLDKILPLTKLCFELLVKEAGGAVGHSNQSFIGTNYSLIKEFETISLQNQ
jgi:fructose-1,6-bisphosphatase/inositol monophosphatase family enzyme